VKKGEEDLKIIKEDIKRQQKQFEETIKTQEEIIMDMMNRFNDDFIKHKTRVSTELEEVKSQQDILRISYTINEKQLLEKIQDLITNEIKKAIKGKEEQILMKAWIEELRRIFSSFDELKKMHPREFTLRLEEISNAIEMFKQKLII